MLKESNIQIYSRQLLAYTKVSHHISVSLMTDHLFLNFKKHIVQILYYIVLMIYTEPLSPPPFQSTQKPPKVVSHKVLIQLSQTGPLFKLSGHRLLF